MGYSKAPEQPQSRARPICHSHTMTSMRHEPATIHIAAYYIGAHPTRHCATGDEEKSDLVIADIQYGHPSHQMSLLRPGFKSQNSN